KPVSANLSLSGADASNYTVNPTAATTADITAIALTGTITADSKTYNGTAAATVHGSLGAGVVTGNAVSLAVTGAAFDTKDIGVGKPVSANLSLTGADAGNYTVNPTAATTANITAAPLTATGVTA